MQTGEFLRMLKLTELLSWYIGYVAYSIMSVALVIWITVDVDDVFTSMHFFPPLKMIML